ncbi:unnamed protein product, partial [Ectocarpus sp. 12 AP-2014]
MLSFEKGVLSSSSLSSTTACTLMCNIRVAPPNTDVFRTFPGCSIEGVIDNVCGQEVCTPGDEGYTCVATLSPTPAPTLGTTAPESAPQPTPA